MLLSENDIKEKLQQLKNWEQQDDKLCASYTFKDFKTAFATMTRIAFEAERLQHHPNWSNVYNQLNIQLTSHDEGGLTQKDFELAQAIDKIVKNRLKN